MQPRNGFICVERESSDADSAIWKVAGADVGAIAFIPRETRESLPPCGLTELDDTLHAGVDSLLAEGTPAPAASFAGPRDFMAALRARHHRGALALSAPTAFLDRDERIVKVSFRLSSGRVGAGFVHRSTGVTWGRGAATDRQRFNVTMGERYARIDCWQRFSLGIAHQFDGRLADAVVAPIGWLFFTYFLHADGTSQAWCASSYLPSAWFYRDYVRMHRRELEDATADEAEAVLRAKPDAPTGTRWACLDTANGCINAVA